MLALSLMPSTNQIESVFFTGHANYWGTIFQLSNFVGHRSWLKCWVVLTLTIYVHNPNLAYLYANSDPKWA